MRSLFPEAMRNKEHQRVFGLPSPERGRWQTEGLTDEVNRGRKKNARAASAIKMQNYGRGENCDLFCYKGAGETRASFIFIPPRRRAEKVSFVALAKRGVLSVIFSFDIIFSLACPRRTGVTFHS